jgi:hypothetical protein
MYVCMYVSNMYVCKRQSSWYTDYNTLEPNRPQHDRPAACVIAQHYSSATFVSLKILTSKEKLGERLKNVIGLKKILFLKNYLNIGLRNLKMC